MYGSNFWMVTLYPRACSNFPREEDSIPFPNEETTPPVTKIYFVSATIILVLIGEKRMQLI